jgi:prepilin-type N-terminal cleavage/methylation domain-containing protein
MKNNLAQNRKGFTLIEILVVIGILAVLFAIVLIAINPARQFSQANNTKRRSDVNAILNAIHQYAADNHGTLPSGIGNTVAYVADTGASICADLVTRYLAALPSDPQAPNNGTAITDCGVAYDTQYRVVKSGLDNRITVDAPRYELNESISVTR